MIKTRTERTEWPALPATAAGKGLGSLPLGSAQSRAAALVLVAARRENQSTRQIPPIGGWLSDGEREALLEKIIGPRVRVEP